MGKKVQSNATEETGVPGMSARKHKKHHKHRHKRHKDSESVGDGGVEDPPQLPTIKLKLKIGTETMGTKSVMKSECEGEMDVEVSTLPDMKDGADISDGEKEWLDALEAGTLDDNGDVKKARDVSLLTPRQVSLFTPRQVSLFMPRQASLFTHRQVCLFTHRQVSFYSHRDR
ncbi:hypothetical protein NP493_577g00000 [Ridgeia piscesae]|uniref:Uncharacterized protein n=1 Tax=Ridgeia piscesae TaxID=27915 RepID=A0AAD9NRD9_RIDPI|nr:hypothetical protein NP493_577g00000 [Ridgeia piscesae]